MGDRVALGGVGGKVAGGAAIPALTGEAGQRGKSFGRVGGRSDGVEELSGRVLGPAREGERVGDHQRVLGLVGRKLPRPAQMRQRQIGSTAAEVQVAESRLGKLVLVLPDPGVGEDLAVEVHGASKMARPAVLLGGAEEVAKSFTTHERQCRGGAVIDRIRGPTSINDLSASDRT
jgi:hypothetical protein